MMKIYKPLILVMIIGFSLSSCEEEALLDPRDKITGEWLVSEESSVFKKGTRYYSVEITKHVSDSTAIYIEGFYELSGKVLVYMEDLNLSIPVQTVTGYTVEGGNGYVASNYKSISLSYNVDLGLGGEGDDVQAQYSRPEK